MTTTLALLTSAVLSILAGVLANSLRNRNKELDAMAESYNSLRDELTQTQTARAKAIQERDQANYLRDQCERTMRAVKEDRDEARSTIKGQRENIEQLERIIVKLNDERANLYYRNAKGQIAKLHP